MSRVRKLVGPGQRRAARLPLAIVVVVLLAFTVVGAAPGALGRPAFPLPKGGPLPGPVSGGSASVNLPTSLTHVIVVMEENHDLAWTLTDPTFHALYTNNAHATHAYSICHPSASNYIAVTSAAVKQCGTDKIASYPTSNLAGDLVNHGQSWQGLFESMPSACDRTDAYPYVAHHNPWIYYSGLKSSCATHDLSFFTSTGKSRLQQEISSGTLPAFVFVSPNELHDAHSGTLSVASAWLKKQVLTPVRASPTYSLTTTVLVLFDEAFKKSCNCPENGGFTAGGVTATGGPIYLVAVSPISRSTDVVTTKVTDFNVVTTIEWLLGLPSLGHHDTAAFGALKGLFT